MSVSKLPKNWSIETADGTRVVRGCAAGVILSDAVNEATLYDHPTAKLVADNLAGILAQSGIVVSLVVKSRQLEQRPKD